jgi:hypothetical protein
MATSEYGFQQWLTQHAAYSWRPVVIGDFGKEDARKYLEKEAPGCKIDDSSWSKIYEVCGGNAGEFMKSLLLVILCEVSHGDPSPSCCCCRNRAVSLAMSSVWSFSCISAAATCCLSLSLLVLLHLLLVLPCLFASNVGGIALNVCHR